MSDISDDIYIESLVDAIMISSFESLQEEIDTCKQLTEDNVFNIIPKTDSKDEIKSLNKQTLEKTLCLKIQYFQTKLNQLERIV